jgi:glyceraldehyde-3-phosphate dehydrogenase (NADP+)
MGRATLKMMSNNRQDTLFPYESDIQATMMDMIPVVQDEYLLNGRLVSWDGPFRDVFSPVCVRTSDGIAPKVIGKSPLMTEKESLEALQAARQAYDNGRGAWPVMSPTERIGRIESFISAMEIKRDRIVTLLMWEIGKSRLDSRREFDRTIEFTKSTIGVLREHYGTPLKTVAGQGITGTIDRVPVGVVLCMGPFNYPLFETFTALVPALATGNTVIFKPPRFGSLLFHSLLEPLCDLFPPGAVNIIYGPGREIVPPLLSSGMVDALAFIGTSGVATYLKGLHPKPHRLRCVLGLEAKNPAIILPDTDLDGAVEESVRGALAYNGQRCAALKMFFVHTSVVDEFLVRVSGAMTELKCGMPWEEGVFITPLAEPGKPRYLTGLIEDALSHGARVVNGGGGAVRETVFYPALLYPVTPAMRVYHEEQFGPVVPVVPYDDIDEVLAYVAQSNYGQQASVFGRDGEAVAKVVERLIHQVGRVNINCQCQRSPDIVPFTGRKDSAEGSLSVSDAVLAFTVPSLITARTDETNRAILEAIGKAKA